LISGYHQAGRFDEAVTHTERLITTIERLQGPQGPHLPEIRTYLSGLLQDRSDSVR
jgi:hypothetical protein